jgi:replicative DNA helicase
MPEDPLPKLVPYSHEAEEAILGAILINPEAYFDAAEFLQAEDFYIHRHRFIWEAVTRLHEHRTPVDFLTLTEELDRSGKLAEIGGPAYLSKLINQAPTSLHAEAYAHIIEQAAVRRRLLEAASLVAKLAVEESTALETVVDNAEKAILSIGKRSAGRNVTPLSQVLRGLYNQVKQCSKQPDLPGVLTGFSGLDRLLQGLQPSDLVIIAGRPDMGKTSLLLSIVRHAAMVHKKQIAVFTLEMSRAQLAQRLLAQETGIDTQRMRSGRLESAEWPLLTQGIETLSEADLSLDDTPLITPHQLHMKCRRLSMEKGLDLVVVDYLQLMSGGERFESRVQEVSYISRQLKALARELNVPVLAAVQLSRAVEQRLDKHPLLSDLRESGSIEMDADVVVFLHCPDNCDTTNPVDIIVAKQRNGPTGTARLTFRRPLALFENAPGVGKI